MPRRRPVHLLLTVSLLAMSVAAQRPVITVGGVNPDYADLPPAVAAAPPGAVIDVRPGSYRGFVTGKPLRIELHGATVQAPIGAAHAIEIDGLFAADGFALLGPGHVTAGTIGAVRIAHCSGPVMLEQLTLVAGVFQSALDVYDAANVHLARSILAGMPGLQAELAAMVSAENVIGGTLGPGAVIENVLFESSRAIYLGQGGPALRAFSSTVRLSSDGTGSLTVAGAPAAVPIAAAEAFDSDWHWLPSRFQLAPANGAPSLVAINTTEVQEEVPMLNAGPAPLGGTANARLTMGSPTVAMIAVSYLAPLPTLLGDVGLYVDPVAAVLATAGIADPVGLSFAAPVPSAPVLRGAVLCLQGLVFTPPAMQFSGAALWVLR